MLFPYFFPSWTNFWNMYHPAHIVNLLTVYLLASSSHRCLIALCAWISCPPSMITSAFLRSLFFLLHLFADMFLHQMIIKDLLMSSIFTETSSFVNNSVLLMYFNNSLVTGNLEGTYAHHYTTNTARWQEIWISCFIFKTKCPWKFVDIANLLFGFEHY